MANMHKYACRAWREILVIFAPIRKKEIV